MKLDTLRDYKTCLITVSAAFNVNQVGVAVATQLEAGNAVRCITLLGFAQSIIALLYRSLSPLGGNSSHRRGEGLLSKRSLKGKLS